MVVVAGEMSDENEKFQTGKKFVLCNHSLKTEAVLQRRKDWLLPSQD